MQIERWTIPPGAEGRAEWLARRRKYISGTDIACACDVSTPFKTPYALFAEKAGLVEPSNSDNDAMRRGRVFEPAIAQAILEKHPDWQVEKCTEFFYSDELGLSCTPDFWLSRPGHPKEIVQGKTVAKPYFDEHWQDGVPLWILLQTLLEMKLTGVPTGRVAALVTSTYSYELHLFPFERHAEAETQMVAAAAAFWANVRAGREPRPNYALDGDVIRAIYPRDNGKTIDLSRDNRMPELLEQREELSARKNGAEKELKAVNAEIAEKIGDATYAIVPGWEKISFKTQLRKGYTVEDTSYRVLRVKRADAQQEAA